MGAPGLSAAPVGDNAIYQNLKWPGFSLSETEAPNVPLAPGIVPQSAPNLIAFAQGDTQTIDAGTFISTSTVYSDPKLQ